MDIRYRLYPYPVVSWMHDDYKNTTYDVVIKSNFTTNNVLLSFESKISNKTIQDLIEQKKAGFAYHLECPSTAFRTVLCTFKNNDELKIETTKIKNNLQICPFIVATENIKGYTNSDFNDDFENLSFVTVAY